MARQQHFVGLDIGSSIIRAVALQKTEGQGLAVTGAAEHSTEGVRRGALVSPEIVAKNIQRVFLDLKKHFSVVENHATVSIGEPRMTTYVSKGVVSVSRADGEVTREDVTRALDAAETALPRLGNREIIHSFPLFYSIDRDTHIREPVGLIGMKLEVEVLFVAAFTPHVKSILKAMEIADIAIEDIVAAPYAASFHVLSRKQKEVGSLILDIGAQTSTMAVF